MSHVEQEAEHSASRPEQLVPEDGRRPFLVRFFAGLFGAIVALVPLGSGAWVFFSPLRRKSASGKKIRVASLEAIPPDGKPHRFPVIDTRTDKWNVYPPAPVGAVFLRRTGPNASLECFTAECPHLGCSVNFKNDENKFHCPCHDSSFQLDGDLIHPSAAPRDLDPLEVEVTGNGDVLVNFKRFRTGTEKRTEL